ncbi:MAG: CehA/McbA family metallohydrolase [Planctomycetes bacterium]|nr:CehA/McbA family metallohydrolase [Planctomycetota bacterium]
MKGVNPFRTAGQWYRGNTHSHSTVSDGRLSIADRFSAYRDRGYSFLVLTDHGKVSDVSKESRTNFLAISGSEVHPENPYSGELYHIVAIDIHEPIRTERVHPNEAIEQIRAQGGEAVMCHPYWLGHTILDLLPIHGFFAVEVYNDTCQQLIGKGFSESTWDEVLEKIGPKFGIAADDSHGVDHDVFHAWINVKAPDLTMGSILQALKTGCFYSSLGPEIRDIEITPTQVKGRSGETIDTHRIHVWCDPVKSISFKAQRYRGSYVPAKDGGWVTEGEHVVQPGTKYLRVEIAGADGKKAWSNPFFF